MIPPFFFSFFWFLKFDVYKVFGGPFLGVVLVKIALGWGWQDRPRAFNLVFTPVILFRTTFVYFHLFYEPPHGFGGLLVLGQAWRLVESAALFCLFDTHTCTSMGPIWTCRPATKTVLEWPGSIEIFPINSLF